ncbi:copper amine oxidase N-terminal domain-containing protein [Paenibacillus sp. GCM10023252]|uniref:copper amine oxidase N-terminal domain-containing protein n=1 Tax=Paenibacillus sp. GCM10023252 TaxID=3252649 RepID=UPI00360A9692
MKKLIAACVVIGMICCSSSVLAAGSIRIKVNNQQVQTDSAPVIVQGRVLVPLRLVSESLGASVEWNQQQKTAIVSKWSKKAWLTVEKKTVRVENLAAGETVDVPLDVSVKMINSRVYIPMRFISEQLGYKVDYRSHTVFIQSPYAGKYNESYFAQILSGDLSRSRSILVANMGAYGLRNYEHPPLKTTYPAYSEAFLFPEGEALRFFLIENNETITRFEYKDDFFVATWQAHVDDTEGNAIEQLFSDKLKNRTGSTPQMNKSFLYFYVQPYGSTVLRCGLINVDGGYTQTGYKDASHSSGNLSLVLPNEVRKETIIVD